MGFLLKKMKKIKLEKGIPRIELEPSRTLNENVLCFRSILQNNQNITCCECIKFLVVSIFGSLDLWREKKRNE